MTTEEETLVFLEDISKRCADKANEMINSPTKDYEEGLDKMVYSSLIINIHMTAKLMIDKIKNKPKALQ